MRTRNQSGTDNNKYFIPPETVLPEVTFKAVVLMVILTVILSAANAYLGLRVGLTISASIPAAVISMAMLHYFKNKNVLENNMVQTAVSSGEALTAGIIFTIPALIILKTWTDFHYWTVVAITILGGLLGVLFAIPLRRALLDDESLRFPEGVAIGEVLKTSARDITEVAVMLWGAIAGAAISLAQIGFQVIAGGFELWFPAGHVIYGFGIGFGPALIGAGYIVGVGVGLSVLLGIFIGWVIGVPVLSYIYGPLQHGSTQMVAHAAAYQLWDKYIRYIGVGTLLIGGIWAVFSMAKPMVDGVRASFAALDLRRSGKAHHILRTERDISINYVIWGVMALLVLVFIFLLGFSSHSLPNNGDKLFIWISGSGTLIVLILGMLLAAICAYFAGLVGSSLSPISCFALVGIIVTALLLYAIVRLHGPVDKYQAGVTALAVCINALVAGLAAISNDTMQDLKAGQIIGATPWKQQVVMLIGAIVAALVLPLILKLLFNAYGMGGVFPRLGMDRTQMLLAPQANLMAAVVKGIFTQQLQWVMIVVGMVIAIIALIVDKALQRYGIKLYLLAIGLGIYLPFEASTPLVIGGVLSYFVQVRITRKYPLVTDEHLAGRSYYNQRGLLLACGLVAGAALMGVFLAIPFVIAGSSDVWRLVSPSFTPYADILGAIVTITVCYGVWHLVFSAKQDG